MERGEPDSSAAFVTDTGLVLDSGSSLQSRYDAFQSARLNLIVGYRQVNFLRVTGFDALNGTQDMRRGVQAMFTIGRALSLNNNWLVTPITSPTASNCTQLLALDKALDGAPALPGAEGTTGVIVWTNGGTPCQSGNEATASAVTNLFLRLVPAS